MSVTLWDMARAESDDLPIAGEPDTESGTSPSGTPPSETPPSGWIVSVKGVLVVRNHVALAKNDRAEWELPGGRLDPTDAGPKEALIREFDEELGIEITVTDLIDSYVYEPLPDTKRLIITYRCETKGLPELHRSAEHSDVAWIGLDCLHELKLPGGYWRSINGL